MLRLTFQPDPASAAPGGDGTEVADRGATRDAAGLLERVRLLEGLVEQLEARLAQPLLPAPQNLLPEVTIARHADLAAAEAAGTLRRVWAG